MEQRTGLTTKNKRKRNKWIKGGATCVYAERFFSPGANAVPLC